MQLFDKVQVGSSGVFHKVSVSEDYIYQEEKYQQ